MADYYALHAEEIMKHRPKPDTLPVDFVYGRQIAVADWRPETLAVDWWGNAVCYLGYRPLRLESEARRSNLDYFHPSAAAGDKKIEKRAFVRLRSGGLESADFFEPDDYYRILSDRRIELPRSTSSYFGVVSLEGRTQDDAMTRKVFGATIQEYSHLVEILGACMGVPFSSLDKPARITFSKSRANDCDLTGVLIPMEFPYAAFAGGSQYRWSHVSLHGLILLAVLLTRGRDSSPFRSSLIQEGLEPRFLDNMEDNLPDFRDALRDTPWWRLPGGE